MTFTKIVAIALMTSALTVGAASAQIKQTQPAEFPPASYKGKQYVDSKGCVFIRAGIDGNVSWVPRVTRSRKVICGFTPTGGTQVASAEPAKPAPQATQITVDTPAPAPAAAAAPAPKPKKATARVVRQTARKRKAAPKEIVIRNPIVEAPVQTARVAAPAPAPAPVPMRTTATAQQIATACPGASALSQQYLRGDGRIAIRCGPQNTPVVGGTFRSASVATTTTTAARTAPKPKRNFFRLFTTKRKAEPAAPTALTNGVTDHRRIVPKHVAINRINTTNVRVPHGYRSVWTDGRLNPKRAEQTLSGRGHMLLVWTNTVPRRLIDRNTGKDVTASVPLVYPYLDEAHQSQDLGEVSIVRRDGQLVKRIVRHNHRVAKRAAPSRTTYSTRSAPKQQIAAAPKPRATVKRKATPSVGGMRFVQIGLFTTEAKARRAAATLSGMGMGAQMAKVRRNGKSYLLVKAGPFNSASATQQAVSRLHSIGYTGARARK